MILVLSNRKRQILASCLGILLLTMLLLIASFNSGFMVAPPSKKNLHEVQVYSKPPDPPPSPLKKQGDTGSPLPSLTMTNVEEHTGLEVMDLEMLIREGDVDLLAGEIGIGGPGGGSGIGGSGGGSGIGGGWNMVGISELDRIPIVRSAGTITYPKEAIDQNINEIKILLHIIIDEKGRAYLVRILENPFPSMNNNLFKYTSTVRFTPPIKLGVPVKAEYAWPLLFQKPLVE